jgi:nicotinate-nucleotide pyrophosphorylase (carboxylating)
VIDAALQADIVRLVRDALAEDIGSGDISAALVPADKQGRARVISRQAAIVCGSAWVDEVFRQLDARVQIDWQVQDGAAVTPGQTLCLLSGPARSLLTGERCALNLLQTLSGTATRAHAYASAVAGTRARVLDTRKTLPGLRLAQKYAVRCGGGHNHRLGLYDAFLIKENHILAAGSISAAVRQARRIKPGLPVEVEVENFTQLEEAIQAGAEKLLLDNMDLAQLREAVRLTAGRAQLEASGGVTLDSIRAIAETGVDFISSGDITKDLTAVDLSMRFVE